MRTRSLWRARAHNLHQRWPLSWSNCVPSLVILHASNHEICPKNDFSLWRYRWRHSNFSGKVIHEIISIPYGLPEYVTKCRGRRSFKRIRSDLRMSLFTTHARTRGFWFFGLIFFILGPGGRESVLNDVEFSQASKTIEKTTIFGRERGAREKNARVRARTKMLQITWNIHYCQ